MSAIISSKNVFEPFFGTPIYVYVRPLDIILAAFETFFFKTFSPVCFRKYSVFKFTEFFPAVFNLILNSTKKVFLINSIFRAALGSQEN